jgi:peptidyl-prolyl cis-trans isomerase C
MLTVNGQTVDQGRIDAEFARMRPHYDQYVQQRGAKPNEDELRTWARKTVIERVLLEQEAAKLELPEDDDKEQKGDPLQLKMQQLIRSITETVPAPSESDVAEYYNRNAEHLQTPEQVHAAHIVKHTQNGEYDPALYGEMLNIRERISKGESFEKLASELSDCSDRSGDLGHFPRGQMVQEFEDVVFSLDPDEVSDVFQTPFGYHIAKLYEKIEPTTTPLEEVRDRLSAQMHEAQRQSSVNAFVDSLKKTADICDDEA